MRVGTLFCGKVEAIAGQSIQTKFFLLGLPILPLESMFVLEDRGAEKRGFPIALHWRSVVLGYLRWWTPLAAGIAGVAAIDIALPEPTRHACAGLGSVLALVWFYAKFVAGRLKSDEVARRSAIGARTGIFAPPEILPAHIARRVAAACEEEAVG